MLNIEHGTFTPLIFKLVDTRSVETGFLRGRRYAKVSLAHSGVDTAVITRPKRDCTKTTLCTASTKGKHRFSSSLIHLAVVLCSEVIHGSCSGAERLAGCTAPSIRPCWAASFASQSPNCVKGQLAGQILLTAESEPIAILKQQSHERLHGMTNNCKFTNMLHL